MDKHTGRYSILQHCAGYAVIILTALLFSACSTSIPFSERRSLRVMSHSQLSAISSEYYNRLSEKNPLSTDEKRIDVIQEVGENITKAVEELVGEKALKKQARNKKFEFILLENKIIANAFALPDGRVVFFSGLFSYIKSRNDIAVVLSHEMGHILAGHANERMSQGMFRGNNNGSLLCSLVKSEEEEPIRYDCGLKQGATASLMRIQEFEADRIGLILMTQAGYNPNKAIDFWKRINSTREGLPLWPLFSHPTTESRIANLELHIKEQGL